MCRDRRTPARRVTIRQLLAAGLSGDAWLSRFNAHVPPYVVDFVWPEAQLVVETDGWEAHRGRRAFEDDRARDAFLRGRGYEVLRFTWRQLEDGPAAVLSVLRRYLRPVASS